MNAEREVHKLKQRLNYTLGRAPDSNTDIEVQSDFAKYFCVLVSGYLETAIKEIILDIVQQQSAPAIASYVEWKLERWTNPNCERILQLIGSFKQEWRKSTEQYLVDERKDVIDGLVKLRNKIAHGESVGTTLGQVKRYYAVVCEVVDFMLELVKT